MRATIWKARIRAGDVTHESRPFDAPDEPTALAVAMTWARLQAGRMKGTEVEEVGRRPPSRGRRKGVSP